MSTIAFRDAVVAHDHAALVATLAPDVTFSSPAVFKPYEGREMLTVILAAVLETFKDFRYIDELHGDQKAMLRFRAVVGDREVEGVDLLKVGPDGLVTDLTVLIRPLSALQAVAAAMGDAIAAMQAR